MKKIVMTIALIMAFGLTAYASHVKKASDTARCPPAASAKAGHGHAE